MEILDINRNEFRDTEGRATGQTFRCCTQSLSLASDGDHVYLVVNNGNHKNFIMTKLMDLIQSYFPRVSVQYNGKRREDYHIKFPTGGFVKVVSENEWTRNMKVKPEVRENYSIVEIWDHPICR